MLWYVEDSGSGGIVWSATVRSLGVGGSGKERAEGGEMREGGGKAGRKKVSSFFFFPLLQQPKRDCVYRQVDPTLFQFLPPCYFPSFPCTVATTSDNRSGLRSLYVSAYPAHPLSADANQSHPKKNPQNPSESLSIHTKCSNRTAPPLSLFPLPAH